MASSLIEVNEADWERHGISLFAAFTAFMGITRGDPFFQSTPKEKACYNSNLSAYSSLPPAPKATHRTHRQRPNPREDLSAPTGPPILTRQVLRAVSKGAVW